MKANYKKDKRGISRRTVCLTEEQMNAFLEEEWLKKQDSMYKAATNDISAQLLAVMFSTLSREPYNWSAEQLLQFKKDVELTFSFMTTGVLGKSFGTVDCIQFMKNEFGIDFDHDNMYIKTNWSE